jgi:hypothetical protein
MNTGMSYEKTIHVLLFGTRESVCNVGSAPEFLHIFKNSIKQTFTLKVVKNSPIQAY